MSVSTQVPQGTSSATDRREDEKKMTTLLNEQIDTGDVIEVRLTGGDVVSTMVLLATDEFVILDACDDSTPFVVKRDELVEYRKFIPA
jgi:hypothetical protein